MSLLSSGRASFLLIFCALTPLAAIGCGDDTEPPPGDDPGSLVRVTTTSQVGVLLDEFPEASRDRIATELLSKSSEWWTERARWQLRLTSPRLVYRKYYFDESEWDSKNALPLPPEEVWKISLDESGPKRITVDGHDVVAVGYQFEGVLVSDLDSPGVSEPALATEGGTWDEAFTFPVDPTLLLQRTGYACMTEDQFPAESVDAEDAYRFFDDTCEREDPDEQLCHYTEPLPEEGCIESMQGHVGTVAASLHYERLEWDSATADAWRSGEVTTPDSPDLKVLTTGEGLNDNRVKYRYIPPGHCALIDGCVAGPGWRRLLVFDSHDHNVGGQPLHIGEVDYFNEGLGGELIDHNVYEYSDCHAHYHFAYYGSFYYGEAEEQSVQKMGFCLESTDRLSNNEFAPLHTSYECEYQGVDPGWGDLYGASLTCNWVDITELDTSAGPVTQDLTFQSNPDGFLCEGTLQTDGAGTQLWEETDFVSSSGDPVSRPACEETPGAEENDIGKVSVTVPDRGGFVSQACATEHDLGPLRNCGFEMQATMPTCTPGETVTLTCSGASDDAPQVLRVCETSRVLGTGVDCTFEDSLSNVVVEGTDAVVTFTCPKERDAMEPGGQYAIYSAAVWQPDGAADIVCTPQN
ncbi:MAG: hypothetical protein HOW73_21410 [Polyangiaceae bacterium]|nr:hypothetical protein [Polyangiaceae bacterium]